MPGKIKVKILAGRNLPVMDRSGDTTDAYVEIKFGNITYKTDVCRKSLNPQWNSEWYRFEVDDAELQDEPLQIRLMDYDTYSANDAIGKVYLDLNPLLLPGVPPPVKNIWTLEASMNSSVGLQGGSVMTGWIPVYDTMHGIRGEVNIIVKVELFSDFNKFRQSSCGVQFFCSTNIPYGYHAQVIHGFVEELVVSDDPEYKWIDKIRTPRASNEARQTLFFKLSGEVQRKIGLKALDLGGNAVIGYLQNFDLEGESGIVARGIGTAVSLVKFHDVSNVLAENVATDEIALLNLPSRTHLDCSEIDDSVPLLSNSPNCSPTTFPINLRATEVSNRFPGYGKAFPKHSKTVMKVTHYKSAGFSKEKTRQAIMSNTCNINLRKTDGSSQSLSEDFTDEMSIRSMLALEDMRGETSKNRFSRGLKNLRHLPQSVLSKRMSQLKAKISDSVDEESDLDSTFSSTWSIGGSDSNKSSIADLHPTGKKKKLTHKKNAGEGMASLLIRSVHSGYPLDSVKEVRETPTPSPVKCLSDISEFGDRQIRHQKSPEQSDGCVESDDHRDNDILYNRMLSTDLKPDLKYDDGHLIPMISSSETDTSTSDDEPSESSTNYNILDDSSSFLDPGSLIKEESKESYQSSVTSTSPRILETTSPYIQDTVDIFERKQLSFESNAAVSTDQTFSSTGSDISFNRKKSLEDIELLERFDAEDLDSSNSDRTSEPRSRDVLNNSPDIPSSRPLLDRRNISRSDAPILISSSMTPKEIEFLRKQDHMDGPVSSTSAAASTPTESEGIDDVFFPERQPWLESYLHRSISLNEQAIRRANTEFIRLKPKSESFKNEKESKYQVVKHSNVPIIDDEFATGSVHLREAPKAAEVRDTITKAPPEEVTRCSLNIPENNKYIDDESEIGNSDSDSDVSTKAESNGRLGTSFSKVGAADLARLRKRKEKSQKKVERTDTVIYKGPPKTKEKPVMPIANRDITGKIITTVHTPPPIMISVATPPESDDHLHLQVPNAAHMNIYLKCAYPQQKIERTQSEYKPGNIREFSFDELKIAEKLARKYRRHSMLELMKIIDMKMMVQPVHYERRDSTKSKRRKIEKKHISLTPSPDSIQRSRTRRKRSKSKSPEKLQHGPLVIPSLSDQADASVNKHASGAPPSHTHDGPSTDNVPAAPDNIASKLSSSNLSEISTSTPVKETHPSSKKETLTTVASPEPDREKYEDHETAAKMLAGEIQTRSVSSSDINLELDNLERNNASNLLVSIKPGFSAYKSRSTSNLRPVPEHTEFAKTTNLVANMTDNSCAPCLSPSLRQQDEGSSSPANPLPAIPPTVTTQKASHSPATRINSVVPMHRRSSDSDLSITPKGNSLTGSDRSMGGYLRPSAALMRTMNQDTLEMLEYPFITMQQYPPGFVLHIGGFVSARSVKLLERISNLEEPEGRDAWWTEIRMEVRSHTRALACNVVIGYKEETSICDDVCVLSASGTAAVINLHSTNQDTDSALLGRIQGLATTSTDSDREKIQQKVHQGGKTKRTSESNDHEPPHVLAQSNCALCHLPYSQTGIPFRVNMSKCMICRRAKVPDVLFTTVELPENLPLTGRGCFIQATVCKAKRDLRGELNAKEISDCLPFLEYELHSLLLNKLKVKGMNAVFALKVQVSIGERLVVGMAVGTAVFLSALPTPSVPQIAASNSWHNEEQLTEIRKTLLETVKKNREYYQLKPVGDTENGRQLATSDTDDSDEDLPELDLGAGTKDTCILEVDDVEDMDRISLLVDDTPPDDFHVVNTQTIPGLEDLEIVRNLQMFVQVSRAKIPAGQFASMPSKYFARLLQTVYFKLRRMVPCALCDMQFKVALPEQDEIQLSVVGMALGLGEPTKLSRFKRKAGPHVTNKDQLDQKTKKPDDSDMIFSLDEDQSEITGGTDADTPNMSNTFPSNSSSLGSALSQKLTSRSPLKTKPRAIHTFKHVPLKERYGVDITPLSYLPGGKIERYHGNLNFFFIRESTSIRENGGLSGFTHSFVMEVLAIVRAHITALGGNAMVAFFMTQCVLLHSPHKNQGQCLINVGGDVVSVSYFGGEKHSGGSSC